MSTEIVGAFPVGGINVAAAGSIGIATGLIAQLDLALFGSFGLGGASADLSLQFSAALDAEVQIGLSISNPAANLEALASLLANLSLGLSLPAVSVSATAALSANIAAAAAISAQLGGISALIEAALAVKVPAVNFFAQISAALSAGPLFLVSFTDTTLEGGLAQAGADIDALFAGGLVSGADSIAPSDPVYGVIIVTKDPGAFAALGAVLKVS